MGFFEDTFGGDIAGWVDDFTFQNGPEGFVDSMFLGQVGMIRDAWGDLTKAPDYSGVLNAEQQRLFEEKKRRATEANRVDARGSQLARLFLDEQEQFGPVNSFMGY